MNFNKHYDLEGKHAFMSPSNNAWLNDDEEKFARRYINAQAKERGTKLHELACKHILLGVPMPKGTDTFSMYVNDALGFKMTPELVLKYSDHCFGTCDTISYFDNVLRISDYKSGAVKATMRQLNIYQALFCLEYGVNPGDIKFENRIYQSSNIFLEQTEPEFVKEIMNKIVSLNKIAEELSEG